LQQNYPTGQLHEAVVAANPDHMPFTRLHWLVG
jgi:hypothetical protein